MDRKPQDNDFLEVWYLLDTLSKNYLHDPSMLTGPRRRDAENLLSLIMDKFLELDASHGISTDTRSFENLQVSVQHVNRVAGDGTVNQTDNGDLPAVDVKRSV